MTDVADYYTLDEVELSLLDMGRVNKDGEPIRLGPDRGEEAGGRHRRPAARARSPARFSAWASATWARPSAELLAAAYPSIEALMAAASEEDLAAIEGMGPKIAHSVYLFLRTPDNAAVIERLRARGVRAGGRRRRPRPSSCPRRLRVSRSC